MAWYWWALIGVGVVSLGALKLFVLNKIKGKNAAKPNCIDED